MEPEILLCIVMLVAATFYAVLGGADFGAGIWEFMTALQSSEKERRHIYKAIGPVWEANHVWIVFVLVILMNGFPVAFAGISRALWFPLLVAVWGIIFRGAGYAFRSYTLGGRWEQTIWEVMFAAASTATPLFLGSVAGAVASGKLEISPDGEYNGDYIIDWLSPLAMFAGFYTIGMCAFLSSVYLVREANVVSDEELTTLWRQRALSTGLWMGLLSAAGLALVAIEAPVLARGFLHRGWPLIVVSLLCGIGSLIEVWRRNFNRAIVASAGAVASVIWGWGVSQFPVLIPPNITVEAAAAPDNILWMMLGVIAAGTIIMLPALGYLFWLFKSRAATESLSPKETSE